jgi:hypothetical protein
MEAAFHTNPSKEAMNTFEKGDDVITNVTVGAGRICPTTYLNRTTPPNSLRCRREPSKQGQAKSDRRRARPGRRRRHLVRPSSSRQHRSRPCGPAGADLGRPIRPWGAPGSASRWRSPRSRYVTEFIILGRTAHISQPPLGISALAPLSSGTTPPPQDPSPAAAGRRSPSSSPARVGTSASPPEVRALLFPLFIYTPSPPPPLHCRASPRSAAPICLRSRR